MMNLIRKEFIILKKYFSYLILYTIFAVIAFSTSAEMAKSSYIISAVGIIYTLIQYGCAIEEKNKSERILNSLPIHRKDIVLSKYVSSILLSVITVIAVGITGMLASNLPFVYIHKIGLEDIIGIFTSTWLLISIYLPIYFKFGYIKGKLFNMGIFFIFFFGSMYVNEYLSKYVGHSFIRSVVSFLNNRGILAIGGIIILINISLLIISAFISTKIYCRREFN